MNDSIFQTIKTMLGGYIEGDAFDNDITVAINSVISILTQLGVGPSDGFVVTGPEQTWGDFIGDRKDLEIGRAHV